MKKIVMCFILIIFGLIVSIEALSTSTEYDSELSTDNSFVVDSPLFTSTENLTVYDQVEVDCEEDGFSKLVENGKLSLYSRDSGGAIRIVNKETGFIWASDVLDIANEEYGITTGEAKDAYSAFSMTYIDSTGSIQSINSFDSSFDLIPTIDNYDVLFSVDNSKLGISFSYVITLLDDGVNVKLEHTSILESGDCKIASISFFQFLGSVYQDNVPGYMFIPSGNGGLIEYTENSTITSIYTQKLYGLDYERVDNVDSDIISLPVYGFVHGVNQNALFINITSGASIANINYIPTTTGTGFHQMYMSYTYREPYPLAIPGGETILMVPNDFILEDIEFKLTILEDENANYIGMAQTYQEILSEDGILSENETTSTIHIDSLGREYEQGLIFKKYYNMTTTSDLLNIDSYMSDNGVEDILYTLRGYNSGGYSNMSASNLTFDSKLGSLSDLVSLNAYFYYNPIERYNEKDSNFNDSLVNIYTNYTSVEIETNEKYKFFTQVDDVLKYTNKAIMTYDNIVLDGITNVLYGDSNNGFTRIDTLSSYVDMLSEVETPMYQPNEYLLGSTSEYLNIDLYHDRQRFITDSVPFLQIVLRGYIPYYSSFLNFSSNQELDVLKCVEYGVYPAYLLTYESSYLLAGTMSKNFYASTFSSNEDDIVSQYSYIISALNNVIDEQITSRVILENGVVKVGYSNGVYIYVNYQEETVVYDNIVIEGLSYEVVK